MIFGYADIPLISRWLGFIYDSGRSDRQFDDEVNWSDGAFLVTANMLCYLPGVRMRRRMSTVRRLINCYRRSSSMVVMAIPLSSVKVLIKRN